MRRRCGRTDHCIRQFFPIGHLALRLIGMDPITWDPFRYKLGGRLLNSEGEEFTARHGVSEEGATPPPRRRDLRLVGKVMPTVNGGRLSHFPHYRVRAAPGLRTGDDRREQPDRSHQMPIAPAPIAHYGWRSPTNGWRPK
jgi:hypothetical protein